MMKKIFSKESFIKLCLIFLILAFYVILKNCYVEKIQGYFVSSSKKFYYMYFTFLAILTILLFIGIKKLIYKLNPKKLKIFNIISILILIIGQIFLIYNFDVEQVSDPFYVNDRAATIANGDVDINAHIKYFERYDNNNMVLYTTINVLRVARALHIKNYSKFLVFFNIIMIDISILFLYLIAKKIKDKKFASLALALSVINPLNYLYIFWTYTVTYSLPFFACVIYLWLLIKEYNFKDYKTKNILYCLLFGIVGAYGYLMRPTLIIPLVAFIIIFIYDLINKNIKFKEKYISLILIILSLVISLKAFNIVTKKYVGEQKNTFPITHWIMMGLHGNGTLSYEDNDFTGSFKTKKEMKKATTDEIIKTLKEYKVTGLIHHLIVKIPKTWSDGSAGYYLRMRQDRNLGSLHLYLTGEKRDIVDLYCKTYRFVIYIFILIFLIKELLKKKYEQIDFSCLILLGAIVFYLIWEAKSAYSVPFTLVLTILATKGLNISCDKLNNINKKKIKISLILIILFSIASLGLGYKFFVLNKHKIKEYSTYVTNTAGLKSINDVYKKDKEIVQTFTSNNKFNRIAIMASKLSESSASYNIELMNDDEVLLSEKVDYTNINESNDFITIKVPKTANVKKGIQYKIVITKDKDSKKHDIEDSIGWNYVQSFTMDNYDGTLYIDGEALDDDLYTRIYKLHKTSYINKYLYIIISIFIISIEVLFGILYLKKKDIVLEENIKEKSITKTINNKKKSNNNSKRKKNNKKKKKK